MASVNIFWDPEGREIDHLGTDRFLRVTDGDTPYVSMSIRMLSIDAPEVHYPGNVRPSKHDAKLKELADWIQQDKAPLEEGLAAHLHPKLASGRAGTLQEEQGERATGFFRDLLREKLARPGGGERPVFLWAADEHFDQYGRLLAYLAPHYSATERQEMRREERATFNLLMVRSGWAAPFPIYPSVPKYADLVLLREAAKDAFDQRRGIWAEPLTLTGYEFRMCVRLYDVTKRLVAGTTLPSRERYGWVERYCVDMTTREVFGPKDYYRVPPYDRIFVWPDDIADAVSTMNLVPAG